MKKIITALFAVAAFTFSASAQNKNNTNEEKGYHKKHEGKGMMGMQKLNLTDAQKQQMKLINEDFKTKIQLLGKDDKAQRKALMQERKNKISAILTPEQKAQFEQMRKQYKKEGRFSGRGEGFDKGKHGDKMGSMKAKLALTDDQIAKMKAGKEAFKQRAKAIKENQSLSAEQKKEQLTILRNERKANFKSYLTAEQIAKLGEMKKNKGDWKEKKKGDGWKEKRKVEDGKEKVKVKTT